MKRQYPLLYLIANVFILLVAFVIVVVRSTCLSAEYAPAARTLGKLLILITAGVIMGLNVESNHFHYGGE